MTPRLRRTALVAAVAVHLLVLYLPRVPSPHGPVPLDKPVHVLIFAAVAWAGLRAGLPARPLAAVLLAHAVVSEVIQRLLLPGRTFDPWDCVADVVGVVLVLAAWSRRRCPAAVAAVDAAVDAADPADASRRARR